MTFCGFAFFSFSVKVRKGRFCFFAIFFFFSGARAFLPPFEPIMFNGAFVVGFSFERVKLKIVGALARFGFLVLLQFSLAPNSAPVPPSVLQCGFHF